MRKSVGKTSFKRIAIINIVCFLIFVISTASYYSIYMSSIEKCKHNQQLVDKKMAAMEERLQQLKHNESRTARWESQYFGTRLNMTIVPTDRYWYDTALKNKSDMLGIVVFCNFYNPNVHTIVWLYTIFVSVASTFFLIWVVSCIAIAYKLLRVWLSRRKRKKRKR